MYAVQTSILHFFATKEMELKAPKRYGILHVRISKSIKSCLQSWKIVHSTRSTVMQQDSHYNHKSDTLLV